jgi:hypothetical protein
LRGQPEGGRERRGEGGRVSGLSVAEFRWRGGRGGREGRRTCLILLLSIDTQILPARLTESGLGANGEEGGSKGGREGGREGRTWFVVLLVINAEVLSTRLTEAGLRANGEDGELGVHSVHATDGAEGVAPKSLFVLEGGDDGAALREGKREGGREGRNVISLLTPVGREGRREGGKEHTCDEKQEPGGEVGVLWEVPKLLPVQNGDEQA